jgi:1,4-alpha-glucan branching enzyme
MRKNESVVSITNDDAIALKSGLPVCQFSLFALNSIKEFAAGQLVDAYNFLGAHQLQLHETSGYHFAVWAPNATAVAVTGPFNSWQNDTHRLFPRTDGSGIWEGFIPGLTNGELYKYYISGYKGAILEKGDPYAAFWQVRPGTASITHQLEYRWKDEDWMQQRSSHNSLDAPWSVYEVHLGSWMEVDQNDGPLNNYKGIAARLVPYVTEMGFTHVELMPVMEYPFDGSWGYQGAGYFAPTARYGRPEEFMAMIDDFHQAGIGVILDWVPSHFPYDAHGLFMFDGTHLYEYADMRKGYHPDWNSYIFDYSRGEVISFLISSARYWFDKFHIDAIRVDAVSSMLKLDYSRKAGEWDPNALGGNGNLEAISFIKQLNKTIYRDFPDVQTIAEESTSWPKVSRPIVDGGLGFGMKWMLGWMHDTLNYFKTESWLRQFQQRSFTFSMDYFYNENFMLALSHDEVVHGKRPMITKMPGDEWQRFANLRLLYTYMFTHPGTKLLFMGDEFGQTTEWNYNKGLDWHLLQYEPHKFLKDCVRDLNLLYRQQPALHELQFDASGFEWIDLEHEAEGVIVYKRKGHNSGHDLLVILNMTPVVRHDWKLKVHGKSVWKEVFNSDSKRYYGTGDVYNPGPKSRMIDKKTLLYEINVHLPPLAAIILL